MRISFMRLALGAGLAALPMAAAWGQAIAAPPGGAGEAPSVAASAIPTGGGLPNAGGQTLPTAAEIQPAPAEPPDEEGPASNHRDPFWPVGYVPRKVTKSKVAPAGANPRPTAVPEPLEWDEAGRHLEINGISHMGREKGTKKERYMAVVNGKVVEAGDPVSVALGNRVYRWRIQEIKPSGLSLSKLDVRTE